MKILHYSNWLGMGGAEKLLAETLPRYKEHGIETELLLTSGEKTPLHRELSEKIKIHDLGCTSLYDPRTISRLRDYMGKYDLIHVHLFPPLYFAAVAKKLSGNRQPMVFTEHSTSNRRMQSAIWKPAERWIYKEYDKIIAITDGVKKALEQHLHLGLSEITVIENGVDITKVQNADPFNAEAINSRLTEKNNLLLQVSSFQEPKDQSTLIRALNYLPDNVKVLLAGDGEAKLKCEAFVTKLELTGRVFFLGLRSDIPRLLKSVDVVVLSSKYEGLSLSSIEGMASGKPFIASDVPGLREVVGGAGILFPKGDEKILAEEISKLLENPQHYNETADRCIRRAAEFDIAKMVSKHIEIYKTVSRNS